MTTHLDEREDDARTPHLAPRTWAERHGSLLVAGGLGLLLVLVLLLDRFVRGR